jgi:hypothetical protein
MIKKMIICLLALAPSFAQAQNVLEVSNVSQPNDVYSSAKDEAAVAIFCHQSIPLTFTSTMDKSATPFKTDVQGSDSIYYIAFPTGNRYRGRVLIASAPGYSSVEIPLELQPKQLVTFRLTDPNAMVDAGCYREHRNRGMAEMKNMNYDEARNQFEVARECSDVDKEENEKNIALIDTLLVIRKSADEAYKLLDYANAMRKYMEVTKLNPYDSYAADQYAKSSNNYSNDCELFFNKAESFFNDKDYERAKELYQRVIDRECQYSQAAEMRLHTINSVTLAKKDHSRVFSYEWRKDVPIGIHYGKYNQHKVGGFFQMDLNTHIFDAIRKDCYYGDKDFPEFNMSFGWTVKIADPVWIHVGPGVTGKFYYGTYLSKNYPEKGYDEKDVLDLKKMGLDTNPELSKEQVENSNNESLQEAWQKTNFAFAISPVIGVTAKYSYFAFRLTYQYRWAIESKLSDFIGKSRISIGVGVAF